MEKILFDGKTVEAWRSFQGADFPVEGWLIENKCLKHCAGMGGGDLVTVESFEDFELSFEWKVAKGANSGVMIRVSESSGETWHTGPEMQLLDDERHPDARDPKKSAGALYGLFAPNEKKKLKSAGKFNHSQIIADGSSVEHWLNGELILSYEIGSPDWIQALRGTKFESLENFAVNLRGHIALQDHGDDVWFRDIRIRV